MNPPAARPTLVEHKYRQAALGCRDGRGGSRRAGSDDDQVVAGAQRPGPVDSSGAESTRIPGCTTAVQLGLRTPSMVTTHS